MRKIISGMLLVCMLFGAVMPVMAAEETPVVTPRYSYISNIEYSLDISSSGVATCKASAESQSFAHTVKVTCHLQYYNSVTWREWTSWSDTGTQSASLQQQKTVLENYTNYRIKVVCAIYDSSNNLLESATVYDYASYIPST